MVIIKQELLIKELTNTSFTYNSETSIPKINSKLLNVLEEREYFDSGSAKWRERIERCSLDSVSIHVNYDCGHDLVIEAGCNSRICPRCNERYRRKHIKKMHYVIGRMRVIRSLLLSPKNYTNEEFNSGFAFKDVNRVWQNIRKSLTVNYKYKIKSFVAVKETIFNKKGSPILHRTTKRVIGHYKEDNWNVHLHIIYDGDRIPQKLISDIMFKTTKSRSRYSWIKMVCPRVNAYGVNRSVKYVAKYIGKFENPSQDISKLADFYMATKNKRIVSYSQNIDQGEFKDFSLRCPICWNGYLSSISGVYPFNVFTYDHIEGTSKKTTEFCHVEKEINAGVLIQKAKEKNMGESQKNKILKLIKKIDKGEGVFVEDISSSNVDNLDEIISALLREGDVFEIRPGKLKVLG